MCVTTHAINSHMCYFRLDISGHEQNLETFFVWALLNLLALVLARKSKVSIVSLNFKKRPLK